MEIILLFLPAILSLSIAELFLIEIKDKGTWFKIKYLSAMALLINFIGCVLIMVFRGEDFNFLFETYAAKTILLFEGLYVGLAIILTFLFIAIYNRIGIRVEKNSVE